MVIGRHAGIHAFHFLGGVHTENYASGFRKEEACEGACEVELLGFGEEVEEARDVCVVPNKGWMRRVARNRGRRKTKRELTDGGDLTFEIIQRGGLRDGRQ